MEQLKFSLADADIFLATLELSRARITAQEYRTIKGQAKKGDIKGAAKGLKKILARLDK